MEVFTAAGLSALFYRSLRSTSCSPATTPSSSASRRLACPPSSASGRSWSASSPPPCCASALLGDHAAAAADTGPFLLIGGIFCFFGFAGRCGASLRHPRARAARRTGGAWPNADLRQGRQSSAMARRARRWRRRPGRSSSPTCRCRLITCWPWPARRVTIRPCSSSASILSIALMGFAATFIARLLHRYRWIAYVGLLIILHVAARHDAGWRGGPVSAPVRLPERLVRRMHRRTKRRRAGGQLPRAASSSAPSA